MINFFAAGRNRELLKDAKPDDLIIIGYYTPNKGNVPTQPQVRAIKVKDFLAGAFADVDAQVLEIGGEGDELVLKGGSIDGTPIPDSVIPMEQIAQGFKLEDVSDVELYSGNAGKYLKINASGNDVEWADPPISIDTNTWDVRDVAFLSTFGNDTTAVRGDGNKPFRTFAGAHADGASIIFIKDGSWGTETIVSNKTYYFFPGTQMYRMRDGGATVTNTKVLGYLKFRSFAYGIELTGAGSDISVECDEFDNTRSVAWVYNGSSCKLKARKIFCNGFNGGGYACALRDGSSLELTVTESLTLYYWSAAFRGTGNNYILRCPDVRQIPGGNYGSPGFCTLINHQGSITQGNTYLVDFMGGKLTRTRGQGSSFGVRDSALLTFVNAYGGAVPSNMKFQNGRVDAGSVLGALVEYIVLSGQIELDNIKIKTTSRPIEMYQRANNSGGGPYYHTFVTRNCSFEGDLPCRLGNFRIGRFFNTNFKTLTGVSIIDFSNVNGNSPGQAYFVNCNAQLASGPGEMLTGFTGKTIGLLNTYSDEVIGVGAVDTWGGHTTVATFELPNLEL